MACEQGQVHPMFTSDSASVTGAWPPSGLCGGLFRFTKQLHLHTAWVAESGLRLKKEMRLIVQYYREH